VIYNIICIIFTAVKIKSRISKYQLALIFNLVYASGQANYQELRRGYFTDEVLAQLRISNEEYIKIRRFTYEQTLKILQIFALEQEDVAQIEGPMKK